MFFELFLSYFERFYAIQAKTTNDKTTKRQFIFNVYLEYLCINIYHFALSYRILFVYLCIQNEQIDAIMLYCMALSN
jgi:hypothetical protein